MIVSDSEEDSILEKQENYVKRSYLVISNAAVAAVIEIYLHYTQGHNSKNKDGLKDCLKCYYLIEEL